MSGRRAAAAALLLIVASGCVARERLTRRFAEDRTPRPALAPQLRLTAFALRAPDESVPAVLTLSGGAQSALVRAALERTGSVTEALRLLAAPLGVLPDGDRIQRTRHTRRVVISLEAAHLAPADRLDEVRLTLRLRDRAATPRAFRFTAWNRFASETEEIDLGALVLTRTGGANARLAGGLDGADVTISGGTEQELQERLSLRQRVVVSAGSLAEDSASVLMQGGPGIPLTGTILFDLELRAAVVDPSIQVTRLRGGADPAGAWVSWSPLSIPMGTTADGVCHADVVADLDARFRVRRVLEGAETVAEGDDAVVFVEGVSRLEKVVLLPSVELAVTLWEIVAGTTPLTLDGRETLFGRASEARELLRLLRTRDPAALASHTVAIGGRPLGSNPDVLSTLTVVARRVGDDC